MRWINTLSFVAGLLALTSVKAEASVESCTEGLLNDSGRYYEMLQVSPAQAARLDAIRAELGQRQAELEQQMDRAQRRGMFAQREWARAELERETNRASSRMTAVLGAWQRERCSVGWAPAPAPVVVRAPVYRAPVVRVPIVVRHPARPRVAVRVAPRPMPHRAPAYHGPVKAPAHKAPAYKAPAYKAPAYKAPKAPPKGPHNKKKH